MRWFLAITIICAAVVALAAPDATAPPAADPGAHFTHAIHGARGVDVKTCNGCHSLGDKAQVLAPAAKGHAPCLAAGCHATDFLNAAKPKQAKARAFCLGCHPGVPKPSDKPVVQVLTGYQGSREHHVEMNHFAHAQRSACRDCHVVDGTSFALVGGAPGHAQCMTCHDGKATHAMSNCAGCHKDGARADFVAAEVAKRLPDHEGAWVSRPMTDVRSCGSEGARAKAAAAKRVIPCFKHEREGHRTAADGAPVQCADCHYVVAKNATYVDLVDLQTKPIIDNSKDKQHAACGRSGCHHEKDVDQVNGGKCELCHADKAIF